MIIAIPSVTKYISDSRKSAYVDTAKEVIGSARNLVNSGELGMYDTNTTYYIPVSAIKTENDLKSDLTPSNIEDTVKTTGVGNRQNIFRKIWSKSRIKIIKMG